MEFVIRESASRQSASRYAVEDDTLGTALRRRLLTVIACCALGLVAGGIYLAVSPKKFVAASTLIVERAIPAGATKDDSLLEAQAEIASSREVVLLADRNRGLGDLPSLVSAADVASAVKRNLHVEAAPRRNLLTITYASENRDDAVKVVDLVAEAYRTYQSDERSRHATQVGEVLHESRTKINDEVHHAEDALAAFDAERGANPPTEAATQRAAGIAEALNRAELETFAAKKTYDDAVADAGPALKGMDDKQLEATLQGSAANSTGESGDAAAQEITALARQLAEMRRIYAENHPSVIRTTQRLQQLRLSQVAGTRQRWQASQAREIQLRESFDKAQRDNVSLAARTAARGRLADDLARARAQAESMDHQLNDMLLSTAAEALAIRIDSPAEINSADHPPLPRPAPTLATAAAIGLVLGGLFALVGEFREAGSLRHVVPIRTSAPTANDAGSALKLRVLAAIPSAERGEPDSPAELARASHLDPFGPIANAVRSMRLAMEIDGKVPVTILLTAAADRQGTTTVASNLALTLARENRDVVLVDLNFASPMVAPLFGIEASAGLTELVAGGAPETLLRATDAPRLDILPAGQPPTDAAAMLNSDAFASMLSMLTSAYDHVVIDAAPLARGDDARIVSSMADATLLVSKPTSASLRRAAGARDLLLMIGANLLGVAISRGEMSRDTLKPDSMPDLTKTDV